MSGEGNDAKQNFLALDIDTKCQLANPVTFRNEIPDERTGSQEEVWTQKDGWSWTEPSTEEILQCWADLFLGQEQGPPWQGRGSIGTAREAQRPGSAGAESWLGCRPGYIFSSSQVTLNLLQFLASDSETTAIVVT